MGESADRDLFMRKYTQLTSEYLQGNPITTKDMGKKFGMSERSVQERLQIAKNIPLEIRNLIRDTKISDNTSLLLIIARLSSLGESYQKQAVNSLLKRYNTGKHGFITEYEFTIDVKKYLSSRGYKVQSEVPTKFGRADIVAKNENGEVMVVEVKSICKTFSISRAVGQVLCYSSCIPNSKPYICMPITPNKETLALFDHHGIGFINIQSEPFLTSTANTIIIKV